MSIQCYLREALQTHVPGANFDLYFAFLEFSASDGKGHKHHILPKKEFPEFARDKENILRISPADHLRAHYYLALCAPKCESFQIAFYLMVGNKWAYQVCIDELSEYAEVYARSCVLWKAKAILAQTGIPLPEKHKASLRVGWEKRKEKGLLRTKESYAEQGKKTKGRKQTAAWIEKRTAKLRGRSLPQSQKDQIRKTLEGRPASPGTATNLRAISASLTPEYRSWMGRKGAAKKWGRLFTEPSPVKFQ
jgi:hypothetical protein